MWWHLPVIFLTEGGSFFVCGGDMWGAVVWLAIHSAMDRTVYFQKEGVDLLSD
jgi:hypothetical protein